MLRLRKEIYNQKRARGVDLLTLYLSDFSCSPDAIVISETQGNELWKRIYKLFKSEIAKRYLKLRLNVLTIENISEHFNTFDDGIMEVVRNVEKSRWASVKNQETNNVEQIIEFAEKRLKFLDELMINSL